MLRIYLVILILLVLFFAIYKIQKSSPEVVAKYLHKTGLLILIFILLILAATGRLNWLFALMGVAVAFIARLLPVFLRYAPAVQRFWFNYKSGQQGTDYKDNSQTNQGGMTTAQAYQVLGVAPGASREEIIKAHKRLMMKVHPDKGGSDFLAAQLNHAKKILLP